MRKQLPIFMTFVLVLTVLGLSYGAGSKKKAVIPNGFPTGGPFSPGILVGDTLYVSGTTGQDLKTRKVPDNFEEEARLCYQNIGAVLKAGGMDFSNVVSVQVFLTDTSLFSRMNAEYIKVFPDPKPVRTTVGTALVGSAHMEVTVIARK